MRQNRRNMKQESATCKAIDTDVAVVHQHTHFQMYVHQQDTGGSTVSEHGMHVQMRWLHQRQPAH